MRVWYVTVEERQTRRLTVAAPDERAAREDAMSLSGRGCRCLDVVPASYTQEAQAAEALQHLRSQDWLDWNGQPQAVEDWLVRAHHPATREQANARLALAGLRVVDGGDVMLASPTAIPALRRWFASTPWDGAALFAALLRLPGVRRDGPRYFQGVQARTLRLPFGLVVPS